MIEIGKYNKLTVIKKVAFGLYLDGYDKGEILLPNKYVPQGTRLNDKLDVFIYLDSEDKIIATNLRPHAQVGCFAYLKVIDVNPVGAFLDWGLDKDLLVPRPEQKCPMEKNRSYLVFVTLDRDGRIIASSKADRFLDKSPAQFNPGDEVDVFIADKTDLGQKVIINHSYWGLIHHSELFQHLKYGQKMTAFIKKVREDGKIDVVLRKFGQDNIRELAICILNKLQEVGGFLSLHDKSSPSQIKDAFGASKKSFKSAIGQLYKQGNISIEAQGIRLLK
ncbi:CvfB family protein [Legionella spiritensis]|uniref:RNA-binding protein n=1 Tax=Legionella spiritensis TaxID=452 RepID=A0A0W0Z205_LEGSP|nr:S1-like domain-containing RNA-binding protein [Legionella spiritensis]KTD63161.1 RNA-binding protein [Legionella spiritensis]SNV45349.1 RNA-binding protein [Legionella spiritensis]VEG90945.1 RNA-binding protein [Legionella spiritensis]